MGTFSVATRNGFLTDFITPTNYIALYDGDPEVAGTEITGAGYARITTTSADWGTPAAGTVANTTALSFPQATGDWNGGVAITHWAILDTATLGAGTLLASDDLTVAKTVLTDDTASFAIGSMTLTIT